MSPAPPSGAAASAAPSKIAFRDAHVSVYDRGEGRTVGYLHGMLGNPAAHPFLAELAGSGRVLAPCLPGFNDSPPCSDLRSLYDWVVATSEVIDAAGLAGAPFVASSVGAMLALEVAAVRPEAFERLVLVAPLGLWDDDDPVADPFGATLSEQRALLTADPARSAVFFDDEPGRDAAEQVEDGVRRYLTRTSVASLVWPIPEHGLATRIHRVGCPVTLVWGAADRMVPLTYLDRFAALLPNVAGTHVIAGAGHLAEWDRPTEVAACVAEAFAAQA